MTVLVRVSPRTRYDPWIDAPADDPPMTPPRSRTAQSSSVDLRVQVGVGQPPLAPAGEPHAPCLEQGFDEGVGVGDFGVVGVKDGDVGRARPLEGTAAAEELIVAVAPACRRDDDDGSGRAAGQFDELSENGGIGEGAAGDDEGAVRGADLLGGEGNCGKECEEAEEGWHERSSRGFLRWV